MAVIRYCVSHQIVAILCASCDTLGACRGLLVLCSLIASTLPKSRYRSHQSSRHLKSMAPRQPTRSSTITDQFATKRAIQTIGTTGIANPVTTRKIAMMIFSPLLASPQIDCHISSIAVAVRCISPAIRGRCRRTPVKFLAALSW